MEPLLLFFLTIDRCFLLNYPIDYLKSKQKTLLIAAIIIGTLSSVSNEIVFILDLPDKSETSKNFVKITSWLNPRASQPSILNQRRG
jgi:hypothetical protein